jgi:hypothetical protein
MNYVRNDLCDLFLVVHLLKIAQERYGKKYTDRFFPINGEDIYEVYLDMFNEMPELVWQEYYENDDVNLHRFETPEMTEYFQLALKYGEIKRLKRDDNPYIKSAYKHAGATVDNICSYCYGCRLYISKTRRARLYFLTSVDYWMPIETFEELFAFFDFFPEQLTELKKTLEELEKPKPKRKSKAKTIPIVKKEKARKAA